MSAITPFDTERYSRAIENIAEPAFVDFLAQETAFVSHLPQDGIIMIDFGAGYGRMIPFFSGKVKKYLVEIDKNLIEYLRSINTGDDTIVVTDRLPSGIELSHTGASKVIVGIFQNTLGTIYESSWQEILGSIYALSKVLPTEVVISLFRKEKLSLEGVRIYQQAQSFVGEIDLETTDFENGVFRTKTQYFSKWWSEEEIQSIIHDHLHSRVITRIDTDLAVILHLQILPQ